VTDVARIGWQRLTEGEWERPFQLPAYSEAMAPPRLGVKPFGGPVNAAVLPPDDPFAWLVSEAEEEVELRPGLEAVAAELLDALCRLGRGEPTHHLAGPGGRNLADNPFWPAELAARAGHLAHERYVLLLPLALSRTQDDKGRVRWTLLGASELGPERAFWASFFARPGVERSAGEAIDVLARLLHAAYGETASELGALARCGLRVLPSPANERFPAWTARALPGWARELALDEGDTLQSLRYLLTFRPFGTLPERLRAAYLAGRLHLLPFPGSLVFWGAAPYLHLQQRLPGALQLPLLVTLTRRHLPGGLRVPQSGWIHEPRRDGTRAEVPDSMLRPTFVRTNRWDRIKRHEEELAAISRADPVARVLFSTELDAIGLYDKPLARNSQLWDDDFEPVLDGPRADRQEIMRAAERLAAGGMFGYRLLNAPMRVGRHEVTWHRPLIAFRDPAGGRPVVMGAGADGFLTACPAASPKLDGVVELWPRLQRRPAYLAAVAAFAHLDGHDRQQTELSVANVLQVSDALGGVPLARGLARALLRVARHETLESWLGALAARAGDPLLGERVVQEMQRRVASDVDPGEPLTFAATATRAFEEALWHDIATLAHGTFRNKDNADCVLDPATQAALDHQQRDLEPLGDYLLLRHRQSIAAAGMTGLAWCGSLRFHWRTDFEYAEFGGWRKSQAGEAAERDLLVVIPGRDRGHPVVLADHYDTAYMADVYDTSEGGSRARLAARGADDNHSATATLLLAAPIFLRLAREGRLERDVWLLHLTGEEFPSDCLGARRFCRWLVDRELRLETADGSRLDLSAARPMGVFVMDMIAHNRDSSRDIFQIAPGDGAGSARLAVHAQRANAAWNARVPGWNNSAERRGRLRSRRVADPAAAPEIAPCLALDGEVRPTSDPHSALYNTDGQIFSDVGVPVVLFMENYDLHRSGYHDTMDTMENIDLDYGAALAAIAIETVARVAVSAEP
jgi:hypothetical protein